MILKPWIIAIRRYPITTYKGGDENSRPSSNAPKKKNSGPKLNGEIRSPEVRLIGDGDMQYGVVSIKRALEIADEMNLDVVEVSPNAKPPVARLIDYGKFKYQQQKKLSEAKKKQVKILVKEVKFRPGIDVHDLQVKIKSVIKFLDQGDKVKLLMQFRGREMAHKDLGLGKFKEIITNIQEESGAIVESPMKMMGNRAICMIAPNKKK